MVLPVWGKFSIPEFIHRSYKSSGVSPTSSVVIMSSMFPPQTFASVKQRQTIIIIIWQLWTEDLWCSEKEHKFFTICLTSGEDWNSPLACNYNSIILVKFKDIFVDNLHCRNVNFGEGCASPYSAHNETMRQDSYANIWAIIFHLLLPLRTLTVAELGGLFCRDLLEQTSD